MRIRLYDQYEPRQPGFVTNGLLRVILNVDLGGYTFNIYGSMSWTMSEVTKVPWEQVRAAYIELTGDTRDDVNVDWATKVVQNALQEAWALYSQRSDIVGRVAHHHEADVTRAVTASPPQVHPEEEVAMSGDAAEGAAPTGDTRERGSPKIPTRGAMGRMHEMLKMGIQNEEEILRVLTNEYPSAKQLQRNLRYVARITGFTLVKMPKSAAAAPTNDSAEADHAPEA